MAIRFSASFPSGKRSAVIARLPQRELQKKIKAEEGMCRRVNRLKKLSAELKKWEAFDDSDSI